MTPNKYYIGQTLQLKDGQSVVVRKLIGKSDMIWVSYGFDLTGKDIVGIILPSKHCK